MSKQTTPIRRGRRFRAEPRAIGGRAPVGVGLRSATDAFLRLREAVALFALFYNSATHKTFKR